MEKPLDFHELASRKKAARWLLMNDPFVQRAATVMRSSHEASILIAAEYGWQLEVKIKDALPRVRLDDSDIAGVRPLTGSSFTSNAPFPEHAGSLELQHNEFACDYSTAQEQIKSWDEQEASGTMATPAWESWEHKQRAIKTNEVWTLHWYPRTPVSFKYIAAPTFDELIKFATWGTSDERKIPPKD